MPKDNKNIKPGLKIVAITASAVLVVALAATGVLAYAQNNTGSNMTALEELTNATSSASSNATETTSSTTASNNDEENDETTSTASAAVDSECTPVITTEDGAAVNDVTSLAGTMSDEEIETMTAGLNDTQFATLDQLIENACDAVRDGKSVTALGYLSTARDILNDASETDTAEAQDDDQVEDEDESSNVDAADDNGPDEDRDEDS
jgi:hypothetical protein